MTFTMLGAAVMAVAVVACGGTTPGASSTPGATLAPGATATPAGSTPAPTAPGATTAPTGGLVLTGHECDAVPTFSLGNPDPSFPQDETLNAHFPATIDGQPVTDVTSSQWLYFICMTGGQAAVQRAVSQSGGSFNLASLSWGSATANVDGEDVDMTAFRTAGGDSNSMVQYLSLLAAQAGNQIDVTNVSQANVGGKNVYTWTDADGTKNYAYASGDTLIVLDSVTDSQATKILSALP
ncbi:MAG: hypothetical protein ABI452_02625 [Candidatus Limnocylindrales bacterium]